MSIVLQVLDGDTVVLDTGDHVRLDEIDAPESTQAYGKESKCYLESLCLMQDVIVHQSGVDQYGRILARLERTADGVDINEEMVAAGWAWWYEQFSSDAVLKALQDAARNSRIGLWRTIKATPPWIFRRSDW